MLPELDSLADDVTAAILREVPDYARPDDGSHERIVHRVARDAVHQFAARIADPDAPWEPTARMFHDIGRVEAAEGRSLDALQSALRIGARVTWQRLREKARRDEGEAEVFGRIGESIFRYLDELAAVCSAGYAEARAEFAGETAQLRRRLLDMIVANPPAPQQAIISLGRAAGWRLPRRVAVVALADQARGPLPLLPGDVLAGLSRRDPCLLIPDPDGPGRLDAIEAGLRGWFDLPAGDGSPAAQLAAIGPSVPLARAGGSLRWARRALALARRAVIPAAGGVVRCDEHLGTLAMLADPELAGVLSGKVLAPLRGLRPDQADRLAETLLAWLDSADNAGVAALRLHVHPQTVRYRLRQISGLFGDALGDPDARFSLQVALRARRLLGTG